MGRNNRIEKQFCCKCGTLMEDKYFFSHFNTQNGYQVYTVLSFCPHRKHWWDGHERGWRTAYPELGNPRRYFYSDGEEVF